MKKKLITETPNRLFTFGCSFTEYKWATWANILAYEFDCDFYNFGKSGAGNSFIANQITQAHKNFNFTKKDLVIVCWTNISREDRWHVSKGWVTPGNIYSQQDYDIRFVKNWANNIHFALRDFSYIELINSYLKNITNYHFLSMCNITKHLNQWDTSKTNQNEEIKNIADLYKESLNTISSSFYDVLWNNDMDYKWKKDWEGVHPHYSDGHPTIVEHYEYLTEIFDYNFSERTTNKVYSLHNGWLEYIRQGYNRTRHDCGLHDMPRKWVDCIYENFRLREENPIPHYFYH